MTPTDWPSLTYQIALAERLFGPCGATLLGAWFREQIERITDPAFARLFSDHIDLPGVVPGDYNHRLIEVGGRRLLGGIRFYGGDVERPFVEIVAHSFEDWDQLRDCVATEWASFAPLDFRTPVTAGAALPEGAHVDMTVFAARYRDMAPPDGRVALAAFADVEEAFAMVAAKYSDLAKTEAALARNISAADADELRRWHDEGQLMAIRAEVEGIERTVGLFAAASGSVEWIDGDEVNEEVVLHAFNGNGFAASAQKAWAARPGLDPDRLLIGMIDGLNAASRRSAQRAGREAVLDYVFVPIS
jgi:hypothetical protein